MGSSAEREVGKNQIDTRGTLRDTRGTNIQRVAVSNEQSRRRIGVVVRAGSHLGAGSCAHLTQAPYSLLCTCITYGGRGISDTRACTSAAGPSATSD
jgi:hypothetical protein